MVKIDNAFTRSNRGFECPICKKHIRRLIFIELSGLDFQACNSCMRQIMKCEMILNDKKEKR